MSGRDWLVFPMPQRNAAGQSKPIVKGMYQVVRDPQCPEGPHPTRWCGCRYFKNPADAKAYADQQNDTQHSPVEGSTNGTAA